MTWLAINLILTQEIYYRRLCLKQPPFVDQRIGLWECDLSSAIQAIRNASKTSMGKTLKKALYSVFGCRNDLDSSKIKSRKTNSSTGTNKKSASGIKSERIYKAASQKSLAMKASSRSNIIKGNVDAKDNSNNGDETLRPGPFRIIDTEKITELDHPAQGPERRYECKNYDTCLNLGAALNWDNFTCSSCSGEVNGSLLWRAQTEVLKDPMAKVICELPDAKCRKIDSPIRSTDKIVNEK